MEAFPFGRLVSPRARFIVVSGATKFAVTLAVWLSGDYRIPLGDAGLVPRRFSDHGVCDAKDREPDPR
ncbi:hypothetical protein PJL15_04402 [Paenarthrobacter nitroguajacolicus]|nr:hypothetical protein [Paenarthrobacter nitroguajacolicus]